MKYLLDTNICIHWLHGKGGVADAIEQHGLSNCCISEITKAELLLGEQLAIMKGRKVKSDLLQALFSVLEIIPIAECLDLYAQQKAELCMKGMPIEDFDLLIACTAVSKGCILVTENLGHMSRVSGVRIENWANR